VIFVSRYSFLKIVSLFFVSGICSMVAIADSSSPRLAAYYDSFLAICGDQVYEWTVFDSPQKKMEGIKQVGIGKHNRYALTDAGDLLYWSHDVSESALLMADVKYFYAGRSGVFVVRTDDSLWGFDTHSLLGFGERLASTPFRIADNIRAAAIGDSANYYVSQEGALYVRGRAHRGQYGDGKLASTDHFIQTSADVIQVVAHTGHALLLKKDGTVWGTGGNIYGPLGRHGYGDKADRWGVIFEGAQSIATGSSHSLAIQHDHSLWIWGRGVGVDPKKVMSDVTAVAAGNSSTLAISQGALWQWGTEAEPTRIMQCP